MINSWMVNSWIESEHHLKRIFCICISQKKSKRLDKCVLGQCAERKGRKGRKLICEGKHVGAIMSNMKCQVSWETKVQVSLTNQRCIVTSWLLSEVKYGSCCEKEIDPSSVRSVPQFTQWQRVPKDSAYNCKAVNWFSEMRLVSFLSWRHVCPL